MTEITVRSKGVEVHAKSHEWRVAYDGGRADFAVESNAKQRAKEIAGRGVYCELETRRGSGSLWRLVETYTPTSRGKFTVTNPLTSTASNLPLEDTGLQGRIVT